MTTLPIVTQTRLGPSAEHPSVDLLRELLSELDKCLRQAGVPADALRAGLHPDEISSKAAAAGLELHPEVVAWFVWRNGASPDRPDVVHALPQVRLASLDEALARYVDTQEMLESWSDDPELREMHWGRDTGWLALVDESTGLTVEASAPPERSPGIHNAHNMFTLETDTGRAVSLCTYVTWLVEGLQAGAHDYSAVSGLWGSDMNKMPSSQVRAQFY
jgi:hypothetical protein